MDPIANLTLILLLAFLAEGLTEYFARPLLRTPSRDQPDPAGASAPDPDDVRSPQGDVRSPQGDARSPQGVVRPPSAVALSPMWLRYVACIAGIALAFAYRADLLLWFGFPAYHPAIGMALTGILIGRGSNYMHDLVDRYFAPIPKPLDWL
jgi:hypothetical protein